MAASLDALDPLLFRPAPEALTAFGYVAYHQGLQVRPVFSVKLNVSRDILKRLHEAWKTALLDHYRRRSTVCQARRVGAQLFRFLCAEFGISVVAAERNGPGPPR